MNNQIPDPLIEIGFISKFIGYDGTLNIIPSGADSRRFLDIQNISVVSSGKVIGEFSVEDVQINPKNVRLKLSGIDDIDESNRLIGCYVCVGEDQAVKLDPDWEFFHHELIGMRVVTLKGHPVGQIHSIMDIGAHDVYVIRADDGSEILIPAVRSIVKKVDLMNGAIHIDPLDGMLPGM